MKKTLLQLRTDARAELLETTAARWTDAQLNRYLNLGQEDLAKVSASKIRATVSVSIGASSVVVPSSILVVDDIWWEAGGTRYPMQWSNYPFEPNSTDQGTPRLAWLEGDTVKFWPAAQSSGTLLIKGIKRPAAMTDDNMTHDLPDYETVNEALVAFCVWQAYLTDYDPQRDVWSAKYLLLKGDFAKMEAERNPQTARVRDVYCDDIYLPLTPFDYL